ncbi:ead/Ea22-like family protein [Salmonella enterica subsp. enterica serovar Infantis]|uniref:Protein Ead n=1 Tax=Salmonella enterica TaxID=28901 RepID=A0A5Y2UCS8_SALER|nr:protein Ead [Salmonella enterica]ECM4822789.1 ead/Ea22-like family protein [Salmonella enterica subsp. enterica serovar Infantis]EDN0386551.1 protein Ead [Salmonella enterica subsp. enterica serovar Newport]EAP8965948.1 protein Ead [Salmonella enterica]EAY0395057.1 protein Ead [Salmonella enterica]
MTIDKQALRETAEKALPAMQRLLMMPNDELFDEAALNVDGDVDAANAFNLLAGPETMLALLDENLQLQREKDAIEAVALALRDDMRQAREQLEAAEKRNAEQREYYEGVIADGGKRIAELEKGHQEAAKQINSWRRLAKQNIAERGKDISELEAARQHIAEQSAIVAAAEKLVRCKGRYHSELNYRALAKLFGVVTPDLPPLEHENVHYADAAEVEITALRQRIQELEARAVNLPKRSVDEVMHLSGFSRDYAEGWCAGNDNAIHEIRTAGIKVKGE